MKPPIIASNRTDTVWHTDRWLLHFELKETDGFYRKYEDPIQECG